MNAALLRVGMIIDLEEILIKKKKFLQRIDFGVPLHKFAIRPGKLEPSIFFVIKKGELVLIG